MPSTSSFGPIPAIAPRQAYIWPSCSSGVLCAAHMALQTWPVRMELKASMSLPVKGFAGEGGGLRLGAMTVAGLRFFFMAISLRDFLMDGIGDEIRLAR